MAPAAAWLSFSFSLFFSLSPCLSLSLYLSLCVLINGLSGGKGAEEEQTDVLNPETP